MSRERTRRAFLSDSGLALGAIALQSLLGRGAVARAAAASGTQVGPGPLTPRPPPRPARAKAVIYLHMAGSPSQLDLFDDKPKLRELTGKPCPDSLLHGKRFAFIRGVPEMLGSPFTYSRHGESGAELSQLWRHLPGVVDRIAIVRSMVTDQFNHAPAQLLLQTGTPNLGGAALGSWVTYGLGSECHDLPAFIVLSSGGKVPDAGKSVWGSGFLPTVHQGVQCRSHGAPVLFMDDPPGLDRGGRREVLDAVRALNEIGAESTGDPETRTRIEQYELAFRMQAAAPEAFDLARESPATLAAYGARPGHVSNLEGAEDPRPITKGDDPTFANHCLLARRLVERGVRFVQLYDWGWDHHGVAPGEDIDHHLPLKVEQVDRAVTALLLDLEQRGLLDSTLVVWGGEFGRTPMRQNGNAKWMGRDHQPEAFALWLAGGGIRGGLTLGETDELGASVVRDPVTVRDLQATILHLLGFDPWKLTFPFQGLDQRLIGPEGKARVVTELLA